jgi:hypothetical protein
MRVTVGKWVLLWIPMILIAVANGVLRQLWYGKYMGELPAHQLSTLTGILLFSLYLWAVIRAWRPKSSAQAISIGLIWLGLTVAFELLFGHYVAGHPWSRLLQDYDIFAGRVWMLVLIWVAIAPYVYYRLQKE